MAVQSSVCESYYVHFMWCSCVAHEFDSKRCIYCPFKQFLLNNPRKIGLYFAINLCGTSYVNHRLCIYCFHCLFTCVHPCFRNVLVEHTQRAKSIQPHAWVHSSNHNTGCQSRPIQRLSGRRTALVFAAPKPNICQTNRIVFLVLCRHRWSLRGADSFKKNPLYSNSSCRSWHHRCSFELKMRKTVFLCALVR